MAKNKDQTKEQVNDNLAQVIAQSLNSGKGKNAAVDKVAFFLDTDIDAPTNVTGWISTGCTELDFIISNRKHGGIPVGKISEISGLSQCVTEDTLIDVVVSDPHNFANPSAYMQTMPILKVKHYLDSGYIVAVKSRDGQLVQVTQYVDKGILDTYQTTLENGKTIKTTAAHLFWADLKDCLCTPKWVECGELTSDHILLCDDGTYSQVVEVKPIGKHKIVDITVDHEDHSYFGNGILNHNSGKTLLASMILANTQKMGGLAVFIDTESALDRDFMEAIGVDISSLIYIPVTTIEESFEYTEKIIAKVRSSSKDTLVTIVVDSVAGASTKTEMADDYERIGYNSTKSIVMGQGMRKITNLIASQRIAMVYTNQLRKKMNAQAFGEQYDTPGGMALPFFASVRLRLSALGVIKSEEYGEKIPVGAKTKVKVEKNRLGPPKRECEYNIYFNSGIDDEHGILEAMKRFKLVKQGGAWYTYVDRASGEEIKFNASEFKEKVLSDKRRYDMIYDDLSKFFIREYTKDGDSIITTEDESDD